MSFDARTGEARSARRLAPAWIVTGGLALLLTGCQTPRRTQGTTADAALQPSGETRVCEGAKPGPAKEAPPDGGRPTLAIEGERRADPVAWYPSGELCLRGAYVRPTREDALFAVAGDVREGTWTEYHRDGRPAATGAFERGLPHGPFRAWDAAGVLRREVAWARGMKTGTWKSFFASGKPEYVAGFAESYREGPYRQWSESGVLLVEAGYSQDRKSGPYVERYPDGKPKLSQVYADGLQDGPEVEHFPSGQVRAERVYERGHLVFGWRTFHENGAVAASQAADGAYGEWTPQGVQRVEGRNVDDRVLGPRRVGRWRWFDDRGQLEKRATYVDGALEGEMVWLEGGKQVARERFRRGVGTSFTCPRGTRRVLETIGHEGWCEDSRGRKQGPFYHWDEEGSHYLAHYDRDERHGLEINGLSETTWDHGVVHGPAVTWYPGSSREYEKGSYERGRRAGVWRTWFPDGRLAAEGAWGPEGREGAWVFHREDGTLRVEARFRGGALEEARGFAADGKAADRSIGLEEIERGLPRSPEPNLFEGMGGLAAGTGSVEAALRGEPCPGALDQQFGDWSPALFREPRR